MLAGANDVYAVVNVGVDSKTCPTLLCEYFSQSVLFCLCAARVVLLPQYTCCSDDDCVVITAETERIQSAESNEIASNDKDDPHCQRSETMDDGGSDPVWGLDGSGETLSWDLDDVPSWVSIRAMDEDQMDDDDLIGVAIFDITRRQVVDGCWKHERVMSSNFKNRAGTDGAWEWEGWVDIKRERPDDRQDSGCFNDGAAGKFTEEEQERAKEIDAQLLHDQKVLARLMELGPHFLLDLQNPENPLHADEIKSSRQGGATCTS